MGLSRAQEKMARLEGLSNADLLERAWQELGALCGCGSGGRTKKWLMSVPVDADRDSDVLFGEVLMRFAQLEAENEQLIQYAHEMYFDNYEQWTTFGTLSEDIQRRIGGE